MYILNSKKIATCNLAQIGKFMFYCKKNTNFKDKVTQLIISKKLLCLNLNYRNKTTRKLKTLFSSTYLRKSCIEVIK